MAHFHIVKRIRDQMQCSPLEREAADHIEQLEGTIKNLRESVALQDKNTNDIVLKNEQLQAQREAVLTIIGNLKWLSEWERTEIMKAIIPKEKNDG